MPYTIMDHNKCREKVCLLCYNKVKEIRKCNESLQKTICENYLTPDFDFNDPRFPTSICSSCRLIIQQNGKRNFSKRIKLFDHSSLPNFTRFHFELSSTTCPCQLCAIAKSNIHSQVYCVPKNKTGRPKTIDSSPVRSSKLCSKCLSEIYKGKTHNCNHTTMKENIIDLSFESNTAEQICSSVIRSKIEENGQFPLTFKNTSGPNINLKLPEKPKMFEFSDILNIKNNLNLSQNETHFLCQNIRQTLGARNSIEANMKDKLIALNKKLDNYFVVEEF